MGHERDQVIATLQRLGLELKNPGALDPEGANMFAEIYEEEAHPFFLLAAEDERGPAFSHVLHYDAEMVEDDDAYSGWVHEWARATGQEERVADVASEIDFDGGQGSTYVWLPAAGVAEFRELFPEAVGG